MVTGVLLQAKQLCKTFGEGDYWLNALSGVDLTLMAGETLAIEGASGCGKTTLLNILGGLDAPSQGQVWFKGQRLDYTQQRLLTQYRREALGFVFQFYHLLPSLTALENVTLAAALNPHSLKPEDALQAVGLQARAQAFPAQLSGGEQQRVAIARAVVKRPCLLLCDEPTGALDTHNSQLIMDLLWRMNAEYQMALVVITHNPLVAEKAQRRLMLVDGRVHTKPPIGL